MTLICAILVLFYVINGLIYLFAIMYLLIKKSKKDDSQNSTYPFVSVIIPSRNEHQSISKCLECLKNQNYPTEKFEIIPVNDGSEDGTDKIIDRIAENDPHIQPVHIPVSKRKNQGKLNAIDMGIQHARGEIIITTDADIWMEPNWMGHMVKGFDDNTGLIIGMTLDEFSNTPVHAFQALDGAGIRIIAAALAEINKPITCQGSNLAFRKEAYIQVRERVLALATSCGNREWLMQEIDLATDWEIKTQLHPESIAHTYPPDTWRALINQRSRWASTGKNYSKLSVRLYLTLIYFSLLAFIVGPFILDAQMSGIIWGMKLLIDLAVALAVIKAIHQPRLLYAFPLVFFLQPIMVVITAFLGTFGLYRWK